MFHQNSQVIFDTGDSLCVDIDQHLLKLFENITGVPFFNHSVDVNFVADGAMLVRYMLSSCVRLSVCHKDS